MTSNELKAWRKTNNYSQAELAQLLKIDVMTVSRWERGVRSIPPFLHLALKWVEKEGGELNSKGRKRTARYPEQEERIFVHESQSYRGSGKKMKKKKEVD